MHGFLCDGIIQLVSNAPRFHCTPSPMRWVISDGRRFHVQ